MTRSVPVAGVPSGFTFCPAVTMVNSPSEFWRTACPGLTACVLPLGRGPPGAITVSSSCVLGGFLVGTTLIFDIAHLSFMVGEGHPQSGPGKAQSMQQDASTLSMAAMHQLMAGTDSPVRSTSNAEGAEYLQIV